MVRNIATYEEIERSWTIVTVDEAHEALDVLDELEEILSMPDKP